MPAHDFEFDVRVDAGEGAFALTDAVAAEVLRHLGYAADEAAGVAWSIGAAVREACAAGCACDIRFFASAGRLEVVVACGSRPAQRIVRELPRGS